MWIYIDGIVKNDQLKKRCQEYYIDVDFIMVQFVNFFNNYVNLLCNGEVKINFFYNYFLLSR